MDGRQPQCVATQKEALEVMADALVLVAPLRQPGGR
jgi:hypothetical protein